MEPLVPVWLRRGGAGGAGVVVGCCCCCWLLLLVVAVGEKEGEGRKKGRTEEEVRVESQDLSSSPWSFAVVRCRWRYRGRKVGAAAATVFDAACTAPSSLRFVSDSMIMISSYMLKVSIARCFGNAC